MYKDDFESEFWFTAWQVAEHGGWKGHFFADTLLGKNGALEKRARELIRHAYREKRRHYHTALSLNDELVKYVKDPFDLEEEVTNKLFIEQMVNDPELSDAERRLLLAVLDDHEASLSELADRLGFKHKEQVRRVLLRLRKKLGKWLSYFDSERVLDEGVMDMSTPDGNTPQKPNLSVLRGGESVQRVVLDQKVGVATAGVYCVTIRVVDAETGELLDCIEQHKRHTPLRVAAVQTMREAVAKCRERYGDDVEIVFATNVWECEECIAKETKVKPIDAVEWPDDFDYEQLIAG